MDKNYELIIIGGGPAALTAGIYAARKKVNFLLIAKSFGGQMTEKAVSIENYPGFKSVSGASLIQSMVDHLKGLGAEITSDEATGITKDGKGFSVGTENNGDIKASAVVIASGVKPRPLSVPGEKQFIGKGVSYCTTCDGPLFSGKTVVVVGGGNSGFEAALSMEKIAKKIYILEFSSEVKADATNQERAKQSSNIEVITSASIKKIEGDNFVKSLTYEDLNTKEAKELAVDGIFVEIGNVPASSLAEGLVDFSDKNEIKIDSWTCQTKTPGLFAAGDVSDVRYKQIVVACGEGAKAALSAVKYLQGGVK